MHIDVAANAQALIRFQTIDAGKRTWVQDTRTVTLHRDARCTFWQQHTTAHIAVTQSLHTTVEQGAALRCFDSSSHNAFHYMQSAIDLVGAHASCHMMGYFRTFEHARAHMRLTVQHRAPNTKSHQCYRGIVSAHGQALFDSHVQVHRGAKGSDSVQMNNNLLLHPFAKVHTLPELQIDEQDVVCSHGATIGALDPQMLFYLQSRGLNEAQSMQLMKAAFVQQVVHDFDSDRTIPDLYEAVKQDMASWV
jgi:Fe-S cluster assembly protein SufD